MVTQGCQKSNPFELLTIIVNNGLGTKMLRTAKKYGACGSTILLGRGTVQSAFLKFLELYDEEKEIILIAGGRSIILNLLERLDKAHNFSKPHHGIAFCTPVKSVIGSKGCRGSILNESEGDIPIMYHAIYVIVDKGNAETVIEAATLAGSAGGTIFNARGSGIHETSMLFSMEIEPEKEVVLIISEAEKTDHITSSISDSLQLSEPGQGIMFVQDVSKVYGLRKPDHT